MCLFSDRAEIKNYVRVGHCSSKNYKICGLLPLRKDRGPKRPCWVVKKNPPFSGESGTAEASVLPAVFFWRVVDRIQEKEQDLIVLFFGSHTDTKNLKKISEKNFFSEILQLRSLLIAGCGICGCRG